MASSKLIGVPFFPLIGSLVAWPFFYERAPHDVRRSAATIMGGHIGEWRRAFGPHIKSQEDMHSFLRILLTPVAFGLPATVPFTVDLWLTCRWLWESFG